MDLSTHSHPDTSFHLVNNHCLWYQPPKIKYNLQNVSSHTSVTYKQKQNNFTVQILCYLPWIFMFLLTLSISSHTDRKSKRCFYALKSIVVMYYNVKKSKVISLIIYWSGIFSVIWITRAILWLRQLFLNLVSLHHFLPWFLYKKSSINIIHNGIDKGRIKHMDIRSQQNHISVTMRKDILPLIYAITYFIW